MASQDDRDRMAEKVIGLMNLAAGTNYEAEAESAMAKAHELILKYALSQDDLNRFGKEQGATEEVGHEEYDCPDEMYARGYHVVARNGFCDVLWNSRLSKITVIGRPTNRRLVVGMTAKVMLQVESMAWFEAEMVEVPMKPWEKKEFRVSFLLGLFNRLNERLKERNRAVDQASSNSMALVLRFGNEVKDYIRANFQVGYGRGAQANNREAYQLGQSRANEVGIHTEVQSGQRALNRG